MLPSPTPDRPSLITNHYSCMHAHVHTHAAAGAASLQHHCCCTVAARLGAHITHLIILLHCCMHDLLTANIHTAAVAPHCLSAVRAHARRGHHTRSCLRVSRLPSPHTQHATHMSRRTHSRPTLHTCIDTHTHTVLRYDREPTTLPCRVTVSQLRIS